MQATCNSGVEWGSDFAALEFQHAVNSLNIFICY